MIRSVVISVSHPKRGKEGYGLAGLLEANLTLSQTSNSAKYDLKTFTFQQNSLAVQNTALIGVRPCVPPGAYVRLAN